MHHLAPRACQVINQRPTLLIRSPVLTSALSHLMAKGWRLSTRPTGQKTIPNFQRAPNGTKHGRTSAQHMSAAQTRSDLCSRTSAVSQKAHRGVDQYLTPLMLPQRALLPCSLLSLCTTSLFLCNLLWKHDITESTALSSNLRSWTFLPEKEKWNLITPDYAVKLQASTARGMRFEYPSFCGF